MNEVLVAVTDADLRGYFGAGEAASQVHQIFQSSAVSHTAVLELADWREFWD